MEDRVGRLEEMFNFMAETQRIMADNLVRLTEIEREQNDKIRSNENRFEILLEEGRADRAEMRKYFEETDRKLEQQRLQMEQQRIQHEERMAQLREEADRKLEQQRIQHEERMAQLREEANRRLQQ